MPRPLVAVFQEFANLSLPTPAQADLNTCVVGVAKQVVDFDPLKPSDTASTSGSFPTKTVFNPVGVKGGATLETASAYLVGAEVVVSGQAQVTLPDSTKTPYSLRFSSLASDVTQYEPVSVGHYAYLLDSTGIWQALGIITSVSRIPVGSLYEVNLKTEVPTNLRSLLATPQAGNFRVTKRLLSHVQVPSASVLPDGGNNTVTLEGSFSVKDGSFTVPVHSAQSVCLSYVARRTDLNFIDSVSDASELEKKLGKVDARNPLALAANLALMNSGTKVFVYGVPEDTEAAYGDFQKAALPRSDIYCIVPICLDPDKQLAVVQSLRTKITAMADADTALDSGVPQRFKMVVAAGFPAVQDPRTLYTFPLKDTEEIEAVEVTSLGGTKYRILYPGGSFYSSGVRVGDRVTSDPTAWFGSSVYTVVEVVSDTALIVQTAAGVPAPNLTTADYSIVRKLDEAAVCESLAAMPKGVASKRVVMLLGDSVRVRSVDPVNYLPAAYLGCAVGGMIAGLPPHSGLTNLYVAGIDDIKGTGDVFSEENLSLLSDAGWCVFVEDVPDASPYCIHGVTTDPSALEFREIMSVKNFDYVSTSLSNALHQFIGTWNINEETLGYINAALGGVLSTLQSSSVPKLGAPLISGQIDSLAQHATYKDRVEIYVSLNMPKSLNTIGLHLVSA